MRHILFLTLASLICLISCDREELTTDSSAKLSFSKDTLNFDTVFTTIGSATKRFMIYNKNDQPINISSIRLFGGASSPFRLNVDGVAGNEISNIRIEAKDSAFVFVQVLVDPNNMNTPLLVEDSLECLSNENRYVLKFRAFGQDVHLIKTDTITSNTTWYKDKPYLILGDLYVDTAINLTIEQGTTVYLHEKSWIIVDGTIIVNGTKENPVVFRGDRLDKANYAPPIPYDKIPGQWGEIWLRNKSTGNKFNYAHVRNAEFGLIVGALKLPDAPANTDQAEVEILNSKFENFSICALYGNGGKVKAINTVFANSEYFNFSTSTGGDYEFIHCTFANYHKGIGVYLKNFVKVNVPQKRDSSKDSAVTIFGDLKKAFFGNCIIYGKATDQLVFDSKTEYKFEYMFDHSLIRGDIDKLNIADTKHFNKPKVSKDDLTVFLKIDPENYIYDWNLAHKSVARDMGSISITGDYLYDYNNNLRGTSEDDSPDAGAFEYIPQNDEN